MAAPRPLSLSAAAALLLAVLAGPSAFARESCVRDVRVERPFPGAVRVVVSDPCRAGRPLTFRHNGREVVRFADAQGRVELLRVLDPDRPDVIVLVEEGGERQVFAEVSGGEPPAGGEAAGTAAPARPPRTPAPRAPAAPPRAAAPTATPTAPPAGGAAPAKAVPTEETGGPPAPAAPVCAVRMEVEEEDGLARIRIGGPCPAQTRVAVRVEPRGWVFHRSFGKEGGVELAVPLVDARVRIRAEAEGGPAVERTVEPTGLGRFVRVLLVWEGGTDLDLHVLEPGGRLSGEARHLHPGNPDGGGRALGRLERTDDGTRLGTKIESYVVERARARGAVLRLFVVDAGRGRIPVPPHCSGGELASPEFRILVADGGEVRERTYRIPPVSCGARLDDRRFFVPAGRVRVR